ncbi:MAG: hypothetical protein AAFX99_35755, partial [Myxococcota bacterium]
SLALVASLTLWLVAPLRGWGQDDGEASIPLAERMDAVRGGQASRSIDFPLPEEWIRTDYSPTSSNRTIIRFEHSTTQSVIEIKGATVPPKVDSTLAFYNTFHEVFVRDKRFARLRSKRIKALGGALGVLDTYRFNPARAQADDDSPRKTAPAGSPAPSSTPTPAATAPDSSPTTPKSPQPQTDPEDAFYNDADDVYDEDTTIELIVNTFVFYTERNQTVWSIVYYGRSTLAAAEMTIVERIVAILCPKACDGLNPLKPILSQTSP